MSGAAVMDERVTKLMDDISKLAPRKVHHLARNMVDGSRPLTVPAALMVLQHLNGCPDKEAEAVPQPAEVPVSRETRLTPPPMRAFAHLPAGYFATPRDEDSDVIDFWLVEPGKGKWEGMKFIRRVLGGAANDAQKKLRSERMENMQQRLAAQAIVDYGIEAAQVLFADKLERCMDCSTPLTDPISRAERRGPHCRAKRR
jgi:hypothetical protein